MTMEQFYDRWANLVLDAAVEAHPGWFRQDEDTFVAVEGEPDVIGLISWFIRTYPEKAEELKRDLYKKLVRH